MILESDQLVSKNLNGLHDTCMEFMFLVFLLFLLAVILTLCLNINELYVGGAGSVGESAAAKLAKKVKAHGAVQIFGWGVLPIGAMVARYAKSFYIHITFQVTGFIFIIAGVALG